MNGAAFALVVNIAVAGLFATSFAVIALASPGYRRVLGFSASYAVGIRHDDDFTPDHAAALHQG